MIYVSEFSSMSNVVDRPEEEELGDRQTSQEGNTAIIYMQDGDLGWDLFRRKTDGKNDFRVAIAY